MTFFKHPQLFQYEFHFRQWTSLYPFGVFSFGWRACVLSRLNLRVSAVSGDNGLNCTLSCPVTSQPGWPVSWISENSYHAPLSHTLQPIQVVKDLWSNQSTIRRCAISLCDTSDPLWTLCEDKALSSLVSIASTFACHKKTSCQWLPPVRLSL
jgi:hypothetical protein